LEFDPLDHARTRLLPLLQGVVALLEEEDQPEPRAFFAGILRGIEGARDATDLAEAFMQLSMSAFLGFRLSAPVSLLLDTLLMHSQQLAEVLSLDAEEIH
jgi:hypothetical protein